MHHLEIEAEEERQAKLAADVRQRAIEIRKAPVQAAMDNFRRRESVVDEKPAVDWSQAPEWANYWAMDSGGTAYWYAEKPVFKQSSSLWGYQGEIQHAPHHDFLPEFWRESLVERPSIQEPIEDDYNAPTSHANRQTTEFERTPVDEVELEKLSQRFCKALDDMDDTVNRPAHYAQQGQIECIDVLEQLAEDGHDFRILNAIKYLWRYRHKGGDESLSKAVWYIQRVLEFPNDE